jgi:hypothetical protein
LLACAAPMAELTSGMNTARSGLAWIMLATAW